MSKVNKILPVTAGKNNTFTTKTSVSDKVSATKKISTTDILMKNVLAKIEPTIKVATPIFNPAVFSPNRNTVSRIVESIYKSTDSDLQQFILSSHIDDSSINELTEIFKRFLNDNKKEDVRSAFKKLESLDSFTLLLVLFLILNENFSVYDLLIGDEDLSNKVIKQTKDYSDLHYITDICCTNSIATHSKHLMQVIPSVYTYENSAHPIAYASKDNIEEEFERIATSVDNSIENTFVTFVNNIIAEEENFKFEAKSFLRIDDAPSAVEKNIWFFSYLYNYSKGLLLQEQEFILMVKDTLNNNFKYFNYYNNNNEDEFYKYASFFQELMDNLSTRTINY